MDAAIGLSRDWMDYGSCRQWSDKFRREHPSYIGPTLWQINQDAAPILGIEARKVVEMALVICGGCMVRYDCARFAVEGRMRGGTWAMSMKQLDWLQKQPDALDLIRQAEETNTEVQVFVRDVKRARNGE